jgi:hypothetical protein
MDRLVRLPSAEMHLKPIQAAALFELHHNYGLFAPLAVGHGKTIISLLAPLIVRSERPLLLIPAALADKTRRDQRKLMSHFRIPNHVRFLSYELLGRPQSDKLLQSWRPDLIVADECHKLKNRKAAVTKRVSRYMHESPGTRFVCMSGTITKRSVKDYWHLLQWALREKAPLPLKYSELEEWADVLDQRDGAEVRRNPGVLMNLCNDEEHRARPPDGLRRAYARRLTETPGVISSGDAEETGASLSIEADFVVLPRPLEEALNKMRDSWTTPNGEAFADALTLWRHTREMASGFFRRWKPPAPAEWLMARATWMAHCREILSDNRRGLDSPKTVANAIDRGLYPEALPALTAWRAIKPTFEPCSTPVWLDPFLVHHVAKRIRESDPMLIWVEHVAFGEALASLTSLPFYGAEGLDWRTRKSIEADPGGRSIILSLASNQAGRNLQDRWGKNYYVSPVSNGLSWEQSLGRTHRPGQLADTVESTVVISCPEHYGSMKKAVDDSRYMRDSLNQNPKLLIADFLNLNLEEYYE